MPKTISYIRLAFLPVLLTALLIQLSCSESGPGAAETKDTVVTIPDTVRPEIPKPAPDATISDSLTHDFSGVWIGDSVLVPKAVSATEGLISFCRNGKVRYQVFKDGPIIYCSAKQVWIDRQHVHIDMYLTRIDGPKVNVPEASMPLEGKLFATGDLISSSRMKVLWYPRDYITAVRESGSHKSPEAFPATFYYTTRAAECE
jgi:hypothetical protein